jgi:hypothetical protein
MLKTTRRHILTFAAALVPVLRFRRVVVPPVVAEPMPVPVPEPAASSPVVTGWWRGPGGWAYHPNSGWIHSMLPMKDLTPANWYGPPPPRPAPIPFDWGKGMPPPRPPSGIPFDWGEALNR